MAGRLWMKSVSWKKTAFKALNDTNTASLKFGTTDTNFLNANSKLLIPERNNSMYGRNAFVSSFFENNSTLAWRRHSNYVPLFEPVRIGGGLGCVNLNFAKSTVRSASGNGGQVEGGDSISKAIDGDQTQSKTGIISSMFQENPSDKSQKESSDNEENFHDEKEKEEKQEESPFLRSQRIAKWVLLGTFASAVPLVIMNYGPPKYDEDGHAIPDQFFNDPVVLAYLKRSLQEINLMKTDIVEPFSEKLLPDPLQEPYYQPPFTLVIELFDVFLRPVYDSVHGWRFKKRPGIEYFLSQVGPPYYEIVIFTKETGMTAFPLIDSMDSKGYIMYRLFRDAARYKSGFKIGNPFKGEWPKMDIYYQKDLQYLNRELSRVVLVDFDKRAGELQPGNMLCLKPWDGSSTDTELYDLAAFLRMLVSSDVDDVRPVLEHYGKYENPLAAFKLAQSRMQLEQEKLAQQLEANKSKSPLLSSSSGGFNMLTKYFKPKN